MIRFLKAGTRQLGGFPPVFSATFVGLVGVLGAHAAWGHGLHYPKQDTLRIEAGEIVVAIRLDFDEDEAVAICDRFDRNGDGRLGEDERPNLVRYLVGEARRSLALSYAGERLNLMVTSKVAQGCDAASPEGTELGVDVVLEAPLPAAPEEGGTFEFGDGLRHAEDEIPVRIELRGHRFASHSEGRVEKSSTGDEVLRGVYVRQREPIAFTIGSACVNRPAEGNCASTGN